MPQSKTPQLRFKGFSGEWEEKKIIDIAPLQRGFDLPKHEMKVGFYPVVMSNGINCYHSVFKVKAPGIVTGRSGTIGVIHYVTSDYWPHNTTLWVTDFKENIPIYIFYMYTKFDLNRFATGSGVPTLNRNDVHGKQIFIPNLTEQTKIGEYFQRLDALIEQKEKKYQKLKQFKTAMLSQMFPKEGEHTPKLRFKGFSGEWEERKLHEIGNATSGTSIESEFLLNGKYKVISIGSYSEQSTYTNQGLTVNLSKKTQNKILNKNDLTMVLNDKTASGNILGRVLLIEDSEKYVYNQRTQRIEPYRDKYNSQFLYQLFNAPLIRNKIINKSQGNTQIYVNWSTIKELSYLIPIQEEQTKIGNYFQKLDTLIDLHQKELEKLKNMKKALFAKMFV